MSSLNVSTDFEQDNDRYVYHFLFYLFLVSLIVLGVVYSVISIMAFGIFALYVFLTSPSKVFYALFFLMPFANIFKASPSSTSFFTYIILLAVLKFVLCNKKINQAFLVCYLVFFCYIMIGANANYAMLIKQATIFPLVYFFFLDNNIKHINFKCFVLNYANAVWISGLVAMLGDYIPNFANYVENDIAYELGLDVTRFTGLYSDPNYYSMALILAMSCIFVMYFHGMIRGRAFVYYGIFTYFGVQTISRSFLILFAILSVLFVFGSFLNRKYKTTLIFSIVLVIALIFVFKSKITIFDGIIDRFMNAKDGDITGNRTKIYGVYMDYFSQNPLKFFWGSGLGAPYLGAAAHNTYIDFLYYYGIIGTILFLIVLINSIKVSVIKKNISNYLPIICIAISIFFLSDLIYFDFVFNLIICLFVFKTDFKKYKEAM